MSQQPTRHNGQALRLGARFVEWGLGLGVFGLFLGLGPIGHYLKGAHYDMGEAFLKNMTLWWACPWTLSVYTIQLGSLGMVVFGAIYLIVGQANSETEVGAAERAGFWLCVVSLPAIFCTGYVGYYVVNAFWPQFYFKPVTAGKNVWLLGQLACILCYFIGAILVWRSLRRMLRAIISDQPK